MTLISSMLSGISGTVNEAYQFTKDRAKSEIQKSFVGLNAATTGGRFYDLNLRADGVVMKCALTVGGLTMGLWGMIDLMEGVEQRSPSKIIKGTVTTLISIAGPMLAYNLDTRIMAAVHQASVLGMASSVIGVLGFKDLKKGHYRSGLCKMALGIAGIAGSALYVYNSCLPKTNQALSQQQLFPFLESHKGEIEEMYETRSIKGEWKLLGWGATKDAYIHADCPGWVIKIPNSVRPENIMIHHENLQSIRGFASKFDRIYLPESHLYPTANGVVLVEEMLKIEPYVANEDQQEAQKQLIDFVEIARLCDIESDSLHNAGILTGTTPPKMGIFDFDCRYKV